MKKLLMLLLCISLLLSCGISAFAAGTADVKFSAASPEAKPGDKITLEITVSCSEVCTSLGLSLEYDSSVFEVVKGKCGLKNGMLSIFDKERGFAYLYPNGATPNGTLGTVTMRVKENAPAGAYEVSGQFSAGNDDKSISASVTGVSITVKGSAAQQEPTQAATVQTEPTIREEPQEQTGVTQAPEEENCVIDQNTAPETEKKPTAQTTIKAKGHTEMTVPGKAATCTEAGLTDGKKCTTCGVTTVAQTTIKAKGHTEVTVPGKAATCTEAGLTDGKKCSTCGATTVTQTVISAKGHTDGNRDFTCDTCGEDLCTDHVEKVIPGKAATCTETGLTAGKQCANCGEVLVAQTPIPTKEHDFAYTVTTAPTQTAAGELTGKCSACSATDKVSLPKLNKTDYTYTVVKAPTEAATGIGRYTWTNKSYGAMAFDVVLEKLTGTTPGDMNGDGVVTDKDVIALLWNVLFPGSNPIEGNGDINGDGVVTDKDVIALLWHVLFPSAYPL